MRISYSHVFFNISEKYPAWLVSLTVRHGFWVVRLKYTEPQKQFDHTLARPRYFFGGFRPRQTPKQKNFLRMYRKIASSEINGGISLLYYNFRSNTLPKG